MIEAKIKELGYELPEPKKLSAQFASVVVHENVAYISGTLPYVDGKLAQEGKVGDTVTVEEARRLAEISVLNILAQLKAEIGSLDKVEQIIKITGFIASATGFTKQGAVMNGATDLLIDIFGERGVHARSAVGTAVMPSNTPVEIEMIAAIKEN